MGLTRNPKPLNPVFGVYGVVHKVGFRVEGLVQGLRF